MSSYNVRLYQESDHGQVLEIFKSGCYEHVSPAFYNALRQPQCRLLLLVGLVLPMVITGSMVLSILGGITGLLVLWLPAAVFFHSFVRKGLAGEMKDIRKHYLQKDYSCFWVVELAGEVVGMVAAVPYVTQNEKNAELKRMFVASHHRGKGIAKLLCRTVIDFARKNGCNAVVLSTTTIQSDGRGLYERMGFKAIDPDKHNAALRLVGMDWIGYRYEVSSSRGY